MDVTKTYDEGLHNVKATRAFKILRLPAAGLIQLHILHDRPKHVDELIVGFDWNAGVAYASINPFCDDVSEICMALRDGNRVQLGFDGNSGWKLTFLDVGGAEALVDFFVELDNSGVCTCSLTRNSTIAAKAVQILPNGHVELPLFVRDRTKASTQ